jgi:hypothetical protein
VYDLGIGSNKAADRPSGNWATGEASMTTTRQITIAQSQRIARTVLAYLNSGPDPRTINIEDQIDGWLAAIGLGWKLKAGTYIDGLSCQTIGAMAQSIRAAAVEKY